MEQIVKLLFATTALSIFVYIFIFASVGLAGNGGEYWGFTGVEEPFDAAQRTFDAGDHRLLRIDLPSSTGGRFVDVPLGAYCDGEPFGADLPSHTSSGKPLHGVDSIRLANEFAYYYNSAMARLLIDELQEQCDLRMYRYQPSGELR